MNVAEKQQTPRYLSRQGQTRSNKQTPKFWSTRSFGAIDQRLLSLEICLLTEYCHQTYFKISVISFRSYTLRQHHLFSLIPDSEVFVFYWTVFQKLESELVLSFNVLIFYTVILHHTRSVAIFLLGIISIYLCIKNGTHFLYGKEFGKSCKRWAERQHETVTACAELGKLVTSLFILFVEL